MSDNEKVRDLVASLVKSLNASALPLAVKELALENVMLRIKVAEMDTAVQGGEKDA